MPTGGGVGLAADDPGTAVGMADEGRSDGVLNFLLAHAIGMTQVQHMAVGIADGAHDGQQGVGHIVTAQLVVQPVDFHPVGCEPDHRHAVAAAGGVFPDRAGGGRHLCGIVRGAGVIGPGDDRISIGERGDALGLQAQEERAESFEQAPVGRATRRS